MKYVVEISDVDGNSVRVSLSIPFITTIARTDNSSWRVLDEGMLKYRSGGCVAKKDEGLAPTRIRLCAGGHWGVELAEMFDSVGLVNSSGPGVAVQPWCVGLKAGAITWALIG